AGLEKLLEAASNGGSTQPVAVTAKPCAPASETRSSRIRTDIPIPPAPYLDRKARALPNLADIWAYINPYMLYGRNLGFKGNFTQALHERNPLALELFPKPKKVSRKGAN